MLLLPGPDRVGQTRTLIPVTRRERHMPRRPGRWTRVGAGVGAARSRRVHIEVLFPMTRSAIHGGDMPRPVGSLFLVRRPVSRGRIGNLTRRHSPGLKGPTGRFSGFRTKPRAAFPPGYQNRQWRQARSVRHGPAHRPASFRTSPLQRRVRGGFSPPSHRWGVFHVPAGFGYAARGRCGE